MKQPNWLRCLQYFIISVVTFEVVIQVECAEYRTIDVVNDGRVVVSDRRSDNGVSDSQVAGEGDGFSPRTGSLDIRSRFWSDTGINQPDYPEEPEEAESSPPYATLSADNGEYVSNLEERSDQHAYVTVDRDRKNKEHLVTISMPRMAMKDKTHLFKKFVIQPVIQYVVQYDKASGRRRVARNGRGVDEEEQAEGQKNFADYEGYQGQDRMRRGHGQKIDRFFNDINANFNTFWGNDGNGGVGGYQNNGGGGGSSGGYQSNGGESSGGYQNSGEGFSQDGGSDGGDDFSEGGSDGGYDATSQMHQPPEVNAFVSGGGYGDNHGESYGAPGMPMGTGNSGNGGNPSNQYGPPGTMMGTGSNGGNSGSKYGPPGTDPGAPLGLGSFSSSGYAGGMTLSNAMQVSNQPAAQNQQQNNPSPMYGPPGMMSVGGGNTGQGQMMVNMGMGGPSSGSNSATGMVQMSGMGMNMGMGGMSQVAPSPMMQGSVAPAQGMMVSMPMSMGSAPSSGFVVSGMTAGQPMVTSQLTPQQMMMMPMSAGGGAMQQQSMQSMAQAGVQIPMGQGQPMMSGGMQIPSGQGQIMMAGGMQVPTTQGQSPVMGGAVNQGNMGISVTNAATSSGVSGSGIVNGAGQAMGSSNQQSGGMVNSNANAAALLMQSMHAQSAALGAIGALTSQMNSNSELGANVQNILMGMSGLTNMGQSMNLGGSGATSGSSGAVGSGGPATSYGPLQELKAPAPSYGPPKEMKEPVPSYGPPKPPTTNEPQGGYGGSGMSAEDEEKGGRGKKPGGMMMGGRGKSKGKGGRGGKSLFSSLSLPKLPMLPMIPTNLGGHLSFMFSTGFGKGKRGGKMGMTGGGGGSSKPSGASDGKPIDQEQVSDHILNILGLTVHHPPRHSLLHSNQSASSITNTTSPLELWEQQGNLSSLNHLTSLIQAGTLEDVVAHLPVPEAADMDMNSSTSSSNTTEQPPTTTDPDTSITSTTSLPITTTDMVTMTTEDDDTLSETTMFPTTTSSPEENVTISTENGTTTTVMPTPTTTPPTTVPPTTTLQVSSTTPRLPLHIRKAKAFYLPAQDIPSSLPTTSVFLTPPPPDPYFLGPTPPQIFPTMSTIYDQDPLKEYINQNIQNNIVTLHDDTTARRPNLNVQNPNFNEPQEFQTSPNIEAYYATPNFNGSPPVKIAQFDPMIYEALRAAFQPGHGTHIDNGVYFFETMNSKRKRNSRNRRRGEVEPIPLKDFRARSRRFHKVKGFTTN